jgi:chromosomal replication initiator protein
MHAVEHVTALTPTAIDGDHAQSWERVRAQLRTQLGGDTFDGFLTRLKFDRIGAGTVHLTAPTRFLKTWIVEKYAARVLALWQAEQQGINKIVVEIRGPERMRACPQVAAPARIVRSEPTEPRALTSGPSALDFKLAADPRLTFATFVEGECNSMALAAAAQVAELPSGEVPVFNPIYFHGGPGCGKTHLLRAIEQHAAAAGREVRYLSAARFCLNLVHGLHTRSLPAWKAELQATSAILIDDAHFITGRLATAEFSRIVQALLDLRRPVVIACDRQPSDLDNADDRLRSRISGGLSIELGPLDSAVRHAILVSLAREAAVALPGFFISDNLLTAMAARIQGSGRDLAGVMNRLRFTYELQRVVPTQPMIERTIEETFRGIERKPPSIEAIQRIVGRHFSIARADMLSARRTAHVVRPRQIAMYLAKAMTLRSLPEIGRRFGGRDHTTVLHAVRKIEAMTQNDAAFADQIAMLKQLVGAE